MVNVMTFYKEDEVFEPYYQVLYNFLNKTHEDLLGLVLKFHEKYTNKIISDDGPNFMRNLERYVKLHNDIVKKIYQNIMQHLKANKEVLLEEENKYHEIWAKQSLERQKFMKSKYIDTIKDGTKLIILGKEYIGKHVEDYVKFIHDDDSFAIFVSDSKYSACSVIVEYGNGPYGLESLLYPYKDLREKFGPEHYHTFYHQNETQNIVVNRSRYCIYNFGTDVKDTPNCKNGGIDELIFKIIAYSYNHFEKIEIDNITLKTK